MAKLKKATFDKIVTAAGDFVTEQKGKWGEDEWRDLLDVLKRTGVDLTDEMQAYLRQLLEAMRGVYQATGSTRGMTEALTTATKGSVEFVKAHKAIWGYSDWEAFAAHVKDNTRVLSREASNYLSEILDSLKALYNRTPAQPAREKTAFATAQAADENPPAPPAVPATVADEAEEETVAIKPAAKAEDPDATQAIAQVPASKAKAAAAAATKSPAESGDDLTAITGIGPALQKKLKDHGIHQYAQIAALSERDIEELETSVIKFSGRIQRDDWVAQAKSLLAKQ